MNKKNVLTAVGIVLSFVIAIGGWVLTSNLIEINSKKLLSVTLNVATNTLSNMSADMTSEIPNNTGDGVLLIQSHLSESEIGSILKNWDSSGRETPHEPTNEQLDMEQAIEAGKEWLSFINGLNIFPDELLQFSNARAYLFQNILLEQNGKFLPPVYSYWKVAFTNESMNINMVINAVTGQVWKTDIDIFKVDVNISEYDIKNAIVAFISALEINLYEDGGVITDELTIIPFENGNVNEIVGEKNNNSIIMVTNRDLESLATSRSFADGNARAEVVATGWRTDDRKWNISNFKMYLLNKE